MTDGRTKNRHLLSVDKRTAWMEISIPTPKSEEDRTTSGDARARKEPETYALFFPPGRDPGPTADPKAGPRVGLDPVPSPDPGLGPSPSLLPPRRRKKERVAKYFRSVIKRTDYHFLFLEQLGCVAALPRLSLFVVFFRSPVASLF